MGRIVLDEALRAKLDGYSEPVELCSEDGHLIGYLMPTQQSPNKQVPFTEQQLDEFRKAGGGGGLAEFWKRMQR